jgi:hypothetical protein
VHELVGVRVRTVTRERDEARRGVVAQRAQDRGRAGGSGVERADVGRRGQAA